MEQGFDLKVESFQARMAALINNSDLPMSIIVYVLKDYYNQTYVLYQKSVEKQYTEFCNEANKEETNKEKTEE